jgi:hypothetical protein
MNQMQRLESASPTPAASGTFDCRGCAIVWFDIESTGTGANTDAGFGFDAARLCRLTARRVNPASKRNSAGSISAQNHKAVSAQSGHAAGADGRIAGDGTNHPETEHRSGDKQP